MSLGRIRWRRRGAWLWPLFAAGVVVDAAVGHLLPPAGDSQSIMSAALVGCVFTLLGVLLLSRPLGVLLRRQRRDLPSVVARNYAGTGVVAAVAALILLVGVIHHSSVVADRGAMREALVRAEAFIGDRAPPEFRRNVQRMSAFAIEPGHLYRACVRNLNHSRSYCVIVDTRRPFPSSVRFDGYEPNAVFSIGVG